MNRAVVLGAMIAAAAVTAALPSSAQNLSATLVNEKVSNPTLDASHALTKTAANAGSYVVEINVDKTAKIATKKFTLGAMDLDDASAPLSKMNQDQCGRYLLQITVVKKNGTAWTEVFKTTIHGVWDDPKTPGHVAHCLLKDGWGSAPKTFSAPMPLPTGAADTYRVVAQAGFTKTAFPGNAKESISDHRRVKVTMNMSQ